MYRAAAALLAVIITAVPASAQTDLFVSEYIEGSSNNKALEIYNGTGAPVDLAAGGYSIQMFFNGSATAGLTINLTGTVAAGDVYVLAQASANATILAQADQTNGSGWFNGDDAVVLRRGTDVVDVIGQIGVDPGTEWGTGLTSTADNTLRRQSGLCAGDTDGSDPFDPASDWDGFATDTFDGLGTHTVTCGATDAPPAVASTSPVNGAVDVALDANLVVTFSEPVLATAASFTLTCGGVPRAFGLSGGPTVFTIDPAADFVFDEACTLTVVAAEVADADTADPPDTMEADVTISFSSRSDVCRLPYTPTYAIQGSGAATTTTGVVTTRGVVVGDYEGPSPALRGFFIQDPDGDGDPATSDGLFVFNANADSVSIGDLVRVTGVPAEFQDQTQLGSVTSIVTCGTGAVAPVDVTLPFPDASFAERYEGMLVRLPQTLIVTEHFLLGRFGEVLLSSGSRLFQPTHLFRPGPDADAVQAANLLNQIRLDDGQNGQNPDPIVFARGGLPLSADNTLRAGDTATSIVGVMTYTWAGNAASGNAWRVRPIGALDGSAVFAAANPRPVDPPDVGGSLRVAGMNLLNYFNTVSGCTSGVGGGPTDCRGAETAAEFERQWPKTVAAVLSTEADVIGIVEIENDGYGPASAIADLVERLNAATAPGTFAYIDVDAATAQLNALGTDAIKVGLVYKAAVVMPIGQTAVLNTASFVTGGDSAPRNRPALAQAFETADGGRVVVVVNHLKSKGSACEAPDAGDGQGNCNAVRTAAAQELAAWLSTDPTLSGGAGTLVLGDLNSYAGEDPIAALESAGFINLIAQLGGPSAYSYVFDGQWGYLDHALASASLGPQVSGVTESHINADEPSVLDYNTNFKSAGQVESLYAPDRYRVSDHDPVVVGLDLAPVRSGLLVAAGLLQSPAGALPSDPGTAGRVLFELAGRYRTRTTRLDAVTTVVFAAGRFRFFSRTADWLTVTDTQAILQGRGDVNGTSGYSYRATVVDGGPGGTNLVRIQVWHEATGALVYDNGTLQPYAGAAVLVP
ncbi:MAG: ExeM/NucH family extracellular endonuclease [Vicinamibacterales bacterium]